MKFGPLFVTDKNGNEIELRSAGVSDAQVLIDYMQKIVTETPYLIREPGESTMTLQQEEDFLRSRIEEERELMLLAFENGKHIGNCSLMRIGNYRRYAHRCSVAIAIYREYCGRGIGTLMLEVMSENRNAFSMYEKLGFRQYGTFPTNMKYADGHYDDALWMMKYL